MFHLTMLLNFRPKKKKVSSLSLKKRNSIGNEVKRNINHPSSKAEPKVVYVPNIATNSEENTISIVSYKHIPILETILNFFIKYEGGKFIAKNVSIL